MNYSIFLGCMYGFLAVALGAFGAHGLQNKLDLKAMGWWQTATQYLMFHAIALIVYALFINHIQLKSAVSGRPLEQSQISLLPAYFFALGCILFSGSLYTMALTGITKLGMITPLGGLSFLVGWLLFAKNSLKLF